MAKPPFVFPCLPSLSCYSSPLLFLSSFIALFPHLEPPLILKVVKCVFYYLSIHEFFNSKFVKTFESFFPLINGKSNIKTILYTYEKYDTLKVIENSFGYFLEQCHIMLKYCSGLGKRWIFFPSDVWDLSMK